MTHDMTYEKLNSSKANAGGVETGSKHLDRIYMCCIALKTTIFYHYDSQFILLNLKPKKIYSL